VLGSFERLRPYLDRKSDQGRIADNEKKRINKGKRKLRKREKEREREREREKSAFSVKKVDKEFIYIYIVRNSEKCKEGKRTVYCEKDEERLLG